MKSAFHRLLSLLLVVVLCVSMVPAAYAAGTETKPTSEAATEPITETTAEETTAVDENPPLETSPPTGEQTDPYGIATTSEDDGIMLLSGDTLSGVTLLDLASPYNYTIYLSSQISVKYKPNGTDSSKTAYLKNIAWHYYSYGGVADRDETVYCIEPHVH